MSSLSDAFTSYTFICSAMGVIRQDSVRPDVLLLPYEKWRFMKWARRWSRVVCNGRSLRLRCPVSDRYRSQRAEDRRRDP